MEAVGVGCKDPWVVEDVRGFESEWGAVSGASAVFGVYTGAGFTCMRTQSRRGPGDCGRCYWCD